MWGLKNRSECRGVAVLALLGALLPISGVRAGSFSVDPVQVNLPANERVASLTIHNSGATPVSIQVHAMTWNQVAGVDKYSSTDNVIISPPIFTIQPGAKQLIRVAVKNRSQATAYRLIAEEIPLQKAAAGQVQVLLRLDLPMFPERRDAKPDVHWRAVSMSGGGTSIEGQNSGSGHERVTEIDRLEGDHWVKLTG